MHCIIFTGGNMPNKEKAFSYIKNYDFCIVADSGLIACEEFGFKPDIILGDFDSLSERDADWKKRLEKYPKEIIQSWDTYKDYSDTELAILCANEQVNKINGTMQTITLIGGSGGRVDHFLAILALFEQSIHPDIWLCENEVMYCLDVNSPNHNEIDLYTMSKTDMISVFALHDYNNKNSLHKLSTCGLEWELNNLEWHTGAYSLSNRISDSYYLENKNIHIKVNRGRFLLITPL